MAKKQKYRGVANPEAARIARELARSGAAGAHDNRANRERSRRDAKAAEIKRQLDERSYA